MGPTTLTTVRLQTDQFSNRTISSCIFRNFITCSLSQAHFFQSFWLHPLKMKKKISLADILLYFCTNKLKTCWPYVSMVYSVSFKNLHFRVYKIQIRSGPDQDNQDLYAMSSETCFILSSVIVGWCSPRCANVMWLCNTFTKRGKIAF